MWLPERKKGPPTRTVRPGSAVRNAWRASSLGQAGFCSLGRGPQGVLGCIWDQGEYRHVLGQNCGGSPRHPGAELAGTGLACCPFPPPLAQTAKALVLLSRPEHHHHLALHVSPGDREGPHSKTKTPSEVGTQEAGLQGFPSPAQDPCPSGRLYPPRTPSSTLVKYYQYDSNTSGESPPQPAEKDITLPFYREGNWSSDKPSNLARVTQQVIGKARNAKSSGASKQHPLPATPSEGPLVKKHQLLIPQFWTQSVCQFAFDFHKCATKIPRYLPYTAPSCLYSLPPLSLSNTHTEPGSSSLRCLEDQGAPSGPLHLPRTPLLVQIVPSHRTLHSASSQGANPEHELCARPSGPCSACSLGAGTPAARVQEWTNGGAGAAPDTFSVF